MTKSFHSSLLLMTWAIAWAAVAQEPAPKITITGLPSPIWDISITPNKNALTDKAIIGTIIRKSNNKWAFSYGYLAGASELVVTMASGKKAISVTVNASKEMATSPVSQTAELVSSSEEETVVISYLNKISLQRKQMSIKLDKPVIFFKLEL